MIWRNEWKYIKNGWTAIHIGLTIHQCCLTHTNIIVLIDPNLQIRDVFTGEDITDVYDKSSPADKAKFALYTINSWRGARQLLIYNKGEFAVLCDDDYPQMLKEIVRYFDKHKDLDLRLLPLCVQKITEIYVRNRLSRDDHGPWRHWRSKSADSLGRLYNQYLNCLNY